MATQNRVFGQLSAFSFNKDSSMVAICPNSAEVYILKTNGTTDTSKWDIVQKLKEHLNPVTAIDWHQTTDQLLTCSTDRSLLVWNWNAANKEYKPTMGAIKEPFANIDACWNERGDKFAVCSASGQVFVGYYSAANQFWIGTPFRKTGVHKSAVTAVRFDPGSSRVVASASTDGTVLLITCHLKDWDKEGTGPFAGVTTFGESLTKFNTISWVNFLAFSPNSETLCFASKL